MDSRQQKERDPKLLQREKIILHRLKAKLALEALRDEKTTSELVAQYEVHPNQISTWKKQAQEVLPDLFATKITGSSTNHEKEISMLHEKIRQLTVEQDFLARASGKT